MIQDTRHVLKEKLAEAAARTQANAIFLSGGLDSGILASLYSVPAITVTLEGYGTDAKYAELLANHLHIPWYHRVVTIREALDSLPAIIRILESFDPGLLNDIPLYFGMHLANGLNYRRAVLGEGADELFGGYSYLWNIKNLKRYLSRLIPNIHFSSDLLANHFSIEAVRPYLDQDFASFAISIAKRDKVRRRKGNQSGDVYADISGQRRFTNQQGSLWGKWILREAFEHVLPSEILWRPKTDLEFGSGMNNLQQHIENGVTDSEFENKSRESGINFINKMHMFLYTLYQTYVGFIRDPVEGEKACRNCGGGVPVQRSHCRTCGSYPI